MADLNQINLIGRLTRDPVAKVIPSGMSLCSFGLATSHKHKDQQGILKEEILFIEITCWGKLAELASKYLKKGRPVFIGGRLKLETWEDKQSGQKRSRHSVVADNIQFLDSKRDEFPVTPESYTPYTSNVPSYAPNSYSPNTPPTHTYNEIPAQPNKDIVKDAWPAPSIDQPPSWEPSHNDEDQPPF